jgi:hypothetical protein
MSPCEPVSHHVQLLLREKETGDGNGYQSTGQ